MVQADSGSAQIMIQMLEQDLKQKGAEDEVTLRGVWIAAAFLVTTDVHDDVVRHVRKVAPKICQKAMDLLRENGLLGPSQDSEESAQAYSVVTRGEADAFFEAVRRGDLAKVKAMIRAVPELVLARDFDGCTPLHVAVMRDQMDRAELLLPHNADINAKDRVGNTPLHYAASGPHAHIVKWLLAHGANVNVRNDRGETPLELATKSGRREAAELLRQ
jgi:hypothetical protein